MNVAWIAGGQRPEDDENFAGGVGWEVTLRRDGTSESYNANGIEKTRNELHTIPSHFNRILETRFADWLEFVSVRYGFEDILRITCNYHDGEVGWLHHGLHITPSTHPTCHKSVLQRPLSFRRQPSVQEDSGRTIPGRIRVHTVKSLRNASAACPDPSWRRIGRLEGPYAG